jgi:hypothetical protein
MQPNAANLGRRPRSNAFPLDPGRSIVLHDVRNDPASLGQPPRRVDEGRIALGERDPV